tara:strand:- start:1520 stop:1810 length:291 start_codon:yes stop_codon:yes gene_type:complete
MITAEIQKVLNTLLSDIGDFNPSAHGECVQTVKSEDNDWEGQIKIFKLDEDTFGPEVFIKVQMEENSYGGDDYVSSIQFVQPRPKKVEVTDFVKVD